MPDVEPEPPSAVGDQSQDLGFVREPPAQQNQPGLEVIPDIGQLEALVEANLAVREAGTLLAAVNLEQLHRIRPAIPLIVQSGAIS